MLMLPVPMLITLTAGLSLAQHRLTSLISLVVLLTGGTYLRRFGPRGVVTGMLLFLGFFLGYFLGSTVKVGQVGWLAAELGLGLVVAILVRFTIFYPHPDAALLRTQRSWIARSRRLLSLASQVIDTAEGHAAQSDSPRALRQLRRQRLRLVEATLIIDAQLADPGALPAGSSARRLHERLFDMELATSQIARFAELTTRFPLPVQLRPAIRSMLSALLASDLQEAELEARSIMDRLADPRVDATVTDRNAMTLAHRIAGATLDLVIAQREWQRLGATSDAEHELVFTPATPLLAGWLPGSALVSSAASATPGRLRRDRRSLAPYTRTAIQMCVAVSAAIAVGDAVSGRRFYWAVLAVFVTFFGANNNIEQARKAGGRVVGTAVGIAIGSVLAQLVGHDTAWSLTVILTALFLGFYLMRVSYAFMVIGITVMISQLYEQLDEFSNSLLVLRLEETAIGAAISIVTVMVVLPLRASRVLNVAMLANLGDLRALVASAGRQLTRSADGPSAPRDPGDGQPDDLRALARALDASHQTLMTTARPVRKAILGTRTEQMHSMLVVIDSCWNHARSLAGGLDDWPGSESVNGSQLRQALETLLSSLDHLMSWFDPGQSRAGLAYVRAELPLSEISQQLQRPGNLVAPGSTSIHELMLIDAALAKLAQDNGMPVHAAFARHEV
jgi:uncharacterized membrane protein YccC